MGWVMMSERELNRIEVLAQVDHRRLSVENGANMPGVTKRQMFRLLKRCGLARITQRNYGLSGIIVGRGLGHV
jgi:hypothetical protein